MRGQQCKRSEECLNQKKLNILQEMIDKWIEEDLKKRKEDRKKTRDTKSQ